MSSDPRPRRLPLAAGGTPALALLERDATTAGSPHVLFCGGFHSSMRGNKARAVDTHCARLGLACTRFDYRGHGESDGAAAALTLADWLDDTLAVIDATAAGDAPLIVIGSSMGAWLAAHAAGRRPARVAALLLVAAAPDFLQERLPAALDEAGRARLARGLEARLATGEDPAGWPVTPALIESGRRLALLAGEAAALVRCPVRMLHGTADEVAPWSRAAALLDRLGSDDATLELLRGADHRLSDPRSLARLGRALDELVALVERIGPGGLSRRRRA